MDDYLSPAARRALRAAEQYAVQTGSARIEPAHLLLAVAEQEESLGATTLVTYGLQLAALRNAVGAAGTTSVAPAIGAEMPRPSDPVREILNKVRDRSLERGPDNPAGTDLILLELLAAFPELQCLLGSQGTDVAAVTAELRKRVVADSLPLITEFNRLEFSDATDALDVYRILDASANRAREGLRVLEDYTRFVCDDSFLTGQLKEIRHQLKEALDRLPRYDLLASRDTQRDVGTSLSTAAEWSRVQTRDVAAANLKRTQEALRSLEEFGKIECRPMAEAMEAARYRLYTLERALLLGPESRDRLAGVVLYVIVTSDQCPGGIEWTVREALGGGAQVIQLREKVMPDRELVALARRVRVYTRVAGALFIMNDRADIARLSEADGVHVGQDDLSVKDARRIVGSRTLVGVSTHSIEQARQAVLDGASYIGVGPLFRSQTKSFDEFPGLDLIRQAHSETRLPAFALGGIDIARLDSVLDAGARRVAVSAAVCAANEPRAAAREFRRRLDVIPS